MATRYIGIGTDEFTVGQGPLMFRNRIINGNFDIWQRGTSQTTHGFGSDDRWNNQQNGSTKTASRQAFTLGQTDVPGEPTYFSRTVVTSVAGAGNYILKSQPIESVRTFAGQTATLSFWAKADASKNMAVEFLQYFGSGGTPSATVTGIGVTTCALTTSWKKFSITVSVPSISGKAFGSNGDDSFTVAFWLDAGSSFNARTNSLGQQSGTFDIAQVQLEAGSYATEFEWRPIGTELALCQRYYQTYAIEVLVASAAGYAGWYFTQFVPFPVVLRKAATPTVTAVNDAGIDVTASSGAGGSYANGASLIRTVAPTRLHNSFTFNVSAEL